MKPSLRHAVLALTVAAASLAPLLLQASPASACSCKGWTPEENVPHASTTTVIRGTVVRIGVETTGRIEYIVAPSTKWKGDAQGYVHVLDLAGCSADLEEGREYVLAMGPFGQHPGLSTNMCVLHEEVSGPLPAHLAFLGDGEPVTVDPGAEPRFTFVDLERGAGLSPEWARLSVVVAASLAAAALVLGLSRRI